MGSATRAERREPFERGRDTTRDGSGWATTRQRRTAGRSGRTPKMLPLQAGEEVVLTASPSRAANFPKYCTRSASTGSGARRNCVVTTRRLLISRGVFRREEHSIAISDIDSARYAARFLNSYAAGHHRRPRATEDRGDRSTSARTARRSSGDPEAEGDAFGTGDTAPHA